ncbi:nucleotidyl transferase AbiEii/AbiGii toxin family protein [Streptomyces sp. SID13666]|uniref:nucleotidyl transferase AbiEii/AbiGii toxin family protein n=1 Tax=unclassified Streptomyces TaxID=2593676 RepID=UPI0013C16E40|nr:nucleotidyl transferase AbiEii/AbiGii toxin family protein [Streptomyces sp. SID13666]NEA73556.1 nucleotidyl transferase AbiEii/AbiGii toxin family protein [Streptomyces sp. SID13588]
MTGRYRDAADLRRALEVRLKQEAAETGTDLARRRRLVVFDRLAARLAEDRTSGWVLKGGAAMEFRFTGRARTTKDLDLAVRPEPVSGGLDGDAVRDLLIEALDLDLDADGFRFRVAAPVALKADVAGRGGWRFSVEAHLAGRLFAGVRVDVVDRGEEITLTERLRLPNTLEFAGAPARAIEAVDRRQHFAEKLHALTRDYGDRPNTRVKDLVDLVLLIESGLSGDVDLLKAVRHVFAVRATHGVPFVLPDPPPRWRDDYPEIAGELTTHIPPTLDAAMALVREIWTRTLAKGSAKDDEDIAFPGRNEQKDRLN